MQIQAIATRNLGNDAPADQLSRRSLSILELDGTAAIPTIAPTTPWVKRGDGDAFWLEEDCDACEEHTSSLAKPTTTASKFTKPQHPTQTKWHTSTQLVVMTSSEDSASEAEETAAVSMPLAEKPGDGVYVSIWIGPLGACLQRL